MISDPWIWAAKLSKTSGVENPHRKGQDRLLAKDKVGDPMEKAGKAKRVVVAACAAACLSGCASLPEDYGRMADGQSDVVAYECKNGDGGDAGKAYFDKKKGLAMMVLSMGLDLTGKALLMGPMMIGEVFFGKSRVVFKIPENGGQSEVTMFSTDAEKDAEGRSKIGNCQPLDAKDAHAVQLREPVPPEPDDEDDLKPSKQENSSGVAP